MPDGQNSVEFVAFDMQEQQWRLKVSIRNEGRYAKPWLKGEWHDYVHQKGLHKGDKVILTMDEEENGERIYRIRAERKHFGFWYSIDDQHTLPWCSVIVVFCFGYYAYLCEMCFVSVGVDTVPTCLIRFVLLPL
ncbi:hypothetical protein POTOM_039148 [Populus tomentosa]|uniref:TF-B3 domain-containing protein n=1 Tax=Populus tomentosa TaxID=118781 RepID=A0A8X7YMV7_POPTO|nr:hypothetical protein POTOM_039148 [Populus tomentosa]